MTRPAKPPAAPPEAEVPRRLHERRWDDLAGVRVGSLVAGVRRPGAPEVVVLPGLGAPGYLLDAIAAIGAWTRCVLLDLPGFGHDGPPACEPDVERIAALAAAWLAAVPPRPVLLAGHSTGAQAALRAAISRPDRVAGLVLAGLTFDPAARHPAGFAARAARFLATESPGEVAAVLPDYRRAGARRLVAMVRSGLADRPEKRIGDVACPLLLLRGARDPLASGRWYAALAERAPAAEVATLRGSHNFPYGHAGATSAVVARFVARELG